MFVTVTIALEFARGTSARRALAGGSWPRALLDLINRNRRRYGGYVVHLSIVLLVVGVTASSAYSTVREAHLGLPSRCASTATRSETTASSSARGPTTRSTSSGWRCSATAVPPGCSTPASVSTTPSQVGNEVDIRTSYATATDLYSILQGVDSNGSGGVSVKVLVNPMVGLVWLAGVVFALGALITIWPDPREARQLARRYGELLARSEA